MIDFKKTIAEIISNAIDVDSKELEAYIEIPKISQNGDYAFPCFRLAQTLKKAPQAIAQEIAEKLKMDESLIEKIDVAGPYVNFYINSATLA